MSWYDMLIRAVGAQAPPSRLPAMLAARRAMVDNPMPASPKSTTGWYELKVHSPDAARVLNRQRLSHAPREQPPQAGEPLADWTVFPHDRVAYRADQASRGYQAGDMFGSYGPTAMGRSFADLPYPYDQGVMGVVSYPRGNRMVRRHEVMHGMNHAAQLGQENMPLWSRLAATNPLGMGRYLDEMGATAAGDGALGVAKKTVDWPAYALMYARDGDYMSAAAAAASSSPATIPLALGMIKAGGALGTGGGYLLSQLQDDSMQRAEAQTAKYAPPPQYFDQEDEVLRPRRPSPPPMFGVGPVGAYR